MSLESRRCSLVSSHHLVYQEYACSPSFSIYLQHYLKCLFPAPVILESEWRKLAWTSPQMWFSSGVWIVRLHLWCCIRGAHSNWSHARVFPLTDLKANGCLCARRSRASRVRKHISDAGSLLLYVLGVVFILLPAKGPFRQRQVSCHAEIGRWMAHAAVDWLLVWRHQHPFMAVLRYWLAYWIWAGHSIRFEFYIMQRWSKASSVVGGSGLTKAEQCTPSDLKIYLSTEHIANIFFPIDMKFLYCKIFHYPYFYMVPVVCPYSCI